MSSEGNPTPTRPRGFRSEAFWSQNQPGFRFTRANVGSREFFADVERHRYELEPHIPRIVQFHASEYREVLEVGCGIATDGARFARAGAIYTGIDQSESALRLARRRFQLEGLRGTFLQAQVTRLPFPDASFDFVYSHGVLHHILEPEAAVREFARVLRPGGEALVMVYHRASFNYWFTIMGVRRILAATLFIPGAPAAVARLTGEDQALLEVHRELLSEHGLRYLSNTRLFLSNNTDGPGNPLSKAYTRREAREMFAPWFENVTTAARFLNLRIYPGGRLLARSTVGQALERHVGWHLYVRGVKSRLVAASS